jgi:putative transcriptional regulator
MISAVTTEHGILPEEWLVSYAAGSLNEGQALMVASHAAFHPELQGKVRQAEDIGGAMLDDLKPATLDQTLLDSVMAMIDDGSADELSPDMPPRRSTDGSVPSVLSHYLGKSLQDLQWRAMGPGMRQVQLWSGSKGEKLWLLKAKGGTNIPMHDHRGTEMTLVLTGSYSVDDQRFTPGLVELADADLDNHQPIIDEGEDCICLVVTEAPIRLHSLIARMAQPFIGL